jgi:glycosyltransferase 2 family protein
MTGIEADDARADAKGAERLKRFVLLSAKCALSVGLLWLLFATYDLAGTMARIAAVDPVFFAASVAGEVLSVAFATIRWLLVLAGIGVSPGFAPAFAIVFIGVFFNQALPSNLGGDAMRVWRLFKLGSTLGRAVGSVMLDRVVALVSLALVVALGLAAAPGLIGDRAALAALWGAIGLVLAGLALLLVFDGVLPLFRRVLPGRLLDAATALARDARAVLLNPRIAPAVMGVSMANHVLTVGIVYALAAGLGIDVAFGALVALVPPVILISMLPISFAGWGVREGAMIAALGYAGVPADEALALSVAFGVVVLLCSLPGAAIWFATGNRKAAA